ncbi:MAG: ATP phosphoribosyltransferase [Micavibrio sp. TMED27]|nr:ATP phosphoribosyltransferase [Micavibrio sp.]OUT92263.1 MAG: ATP phosphoribosyltransferase [Micavibrio sp. TMED27]|tara:strand:- start:223 stop:885 length:663 start_codon:yes stop_codon:yes gene_type:complete
MNTEKLILAVPKGRILEELMPMFEACGIIPEDAFTDSKSRKLRFSTNNENLDIIRVRAFDVATFVAHGGAHIGVVGSDALEEFDYDDIYTPVDLNIGHCRLSVAMPVEEIEDERKNKTRRSHIRIATKYPNLTRRHYAAQGIQAECIKLNGAMEIAPSLGLARHIVDLVSTGSTLKANGLKEVETIVEISSKLVVSRPALKTRPDEMNMWIERFRNAVKK